MRRTTIALAALLVGASLVAFVPATGATAETGDAAAEPRERAPPELPEQWRHTYGASGDDTFADLVRTDDGGYLLVGWTQTDDRDGWVVKVDADGEKQWERSLGGNGTDRFYGVAKTEDGYLLAGRTDQQDGPNGWIVEVGPGGEVRGARLPGPGAFYALERDDSGYLLAGWTRGDGREGWATKLDPNGSEEWSRTYATPDGYGAGYLRAIVPTDDGYHLAGKIVGDSDDAWALSVGPDGAENWQATAGGPSRDDVWAAAPAEDGGMVVAGETETEATGPRDGWLVKFGADGEVEWERRPGGEGTQWLDSAMATDEGFLFTGSSDAESGSVDGYVLATDSNGEVAWESYHGTDSWDKPWPAIRAHDGGYVLAGATSGDGAEGKDGWILRIGETDAGASDGTSDDTTEESTAEDGALQGETATGTEQSASDVPGFGLAGALVALLALVSGLAAARR